MWVYRHGQRSRALMKAPKHTMSNSSLQPSGYGTEKEDKSKRAVLWDAVSTLPSVLHLLLFHQRLQTDEVVDCCVSAGRQRFA